MENRSFSYEDKIQALENQDYMCGGCGGDLWRVALSQCESHHIVPFSYGGNTEPENLVVLCPRCHTHHDDLALCGEYYGGYGREDMDESQIRDEGLWNKSKREELKYASNPKLSGRIFKYKEVEVVKPKRKHKKELLFSREFI